MVEILVALFLAFIVIWTLIVYAGESGRWGKWPVFLLFFFALLAGGLWLTPAGPPMVGVYWVPFLFVAIFIALLWAQVSPAPRRRRRKAGHASVPTMQDDMPESPAGFEVLFWLLLVGLATIVLLRYAMSRVLDT